MPFFKRDDIVIKFGGDDSRFQKVAHGVQATGGKLRSFFSGIGSSLSGVFGRGLIGGVAAMGAAFTALTKSALGTADSIAKTSDKIGVGIEDLQRLRYAASTAGVEQNVLDMALQRFSRRVGEAAQGTGVLAGELDALGIPTRDMDGSMRDLNAILFDYADAVRAAESPQEQLRLAFKAFDSEGAVMVNLLRQGSDGMRELYARAEELGVVIDDGLVRSSEALNQAWDDLTTRWSTNLKRMALETVRFFDTLAGNYRTAADAETALAEKARRARGTAHEARPVDDQTGRGLSPAPHGGDRAGNRRAREAEKTLEDIEALQKGMRDLAAAGDPGGGESPAKPESGTGLSATTDWRKKTLEEQRKALADFRAGKIDNYELAERAKLAPPGFADSLAKDAYGREGNTMGGAVHDGGGALKVGPDIDSLNAQFEAYFASRGFKVRVSPELIGLDGIETVARDESDKTGGTP